MNNRGILLLLGACLLLFVCVSAFADIYSFRDRTGVLHITNVPQGDTRYRLIIKSDATAPGGHLKGRWKSVSYPGSSSRLATVRRSSYDGIVRQAARDCRVDEALVRAVIHAESAFDPLAVSAKGASGLMQLMPGTARRYGVDNIFDPLDNVYGGVRYLRDLLDMFGNNVRLAVAAYNAGEQAVTRYGGIPPYPETTAYVDKVLGLHSLYQHSN